MRSFFYVHLFSMKRLVIFLLSMFVFSLLAGYITSGQTPDDLPTDEGETSSSDQIDDTHGSYSDDDRYDGDEHEERQVR